MLKPSCFGLETRQRSHQAVSLKSGHKFGPISAQQRVITNLAAAEGLMLTLGRALCMIRYTPVCITYKRCEHTDILQYLEA